MNDERFLRIQELELERLLAEAGEDVILEPQLRQRLEEIRAKLRKVKVVDGTLFPDERAEAPRVAIFLKGGGVHGNEGIRPSLAGEALIQYERMFTEQALHDERIAARRAGRQRRPRGASIPALCFTGTPRGSFGLEFEPQTSDDPMLVEVHARSLRNIADAIVGLCNSPELLESAMQQISPRVLPALKRFLGVLAQHHAELRLAFSDESPKAVSAESLEEAAERLSREWNVEEFSVHGVFRGLTHESMVFDIIADGLGLITGTIDEGLSEDDLDRLDELMNSRCIAQLQKTTILGMGTAPRDSYLLLDAIPENEEVASSGQIPPRRHITFEE